MQITKLANVMYEVRKATEDLINNRMELTKLEQLDKAKEIQEANND
jgi:hypothetical protein